MRLTTLIAGFVLTLTAGCSKNNSANAEGAVCFSNNECGSDFACFLGTCVDAGAGLGSVDIDVQPMQGSSALRQRLSRSFDGTSGAQDLTLQPTLDLQGTVSADDTVSGTMRVDLVTEDACPELVDTTNATSSDDTLSYQSTVTTSTFDLRAVPGHYRVVFTPDADTELPPIIQPNDAACGRDLADGSRIDVAYPPFDTLVTVSGRLRYSTDDATGVAGAKVVATATTASGGPLLSASLETGSDGTFSLQLQPDGTDFAILVRPGSNTGVPTQTFSSLVITDGSVGDLVLGVSAPFSVPVTVTDASGAPSTDTTVTATGTVGDSNQGEVTLTGVTGTDGQVLLSLRAGTYTIIAMPRTSAANGLAQTRITVSKDAPLTALSLVVPAKAEVTGIVRNSDGVPVTNARVTYKLRDLATDREVTATTAADGSYTVAVDTVSPTGDPSGAELEVTVEPAADSTDPRHRELARISGSTTIDIDLFEAAFIYGTVYDASGVALPQAALLFYSRLSDDDPVLVGVAQTDSTGGFAVPLPQP